MSSNPSSFWDERYAAGRMPWDQAAVPRAFADYLARAGAPRRALVPGCGSGYELRALHDAGWSAVGVDYSREAVARAQARLGPLAPCVHCADFFAEDCTEGAFDLVYERTFLCALPPALWPGYGLRMRRLVRPGGVLCGFFFFGPEDEPPPHPLAPGELEQLLGPGFERIENAPVEDSLPLYEGKERWQVWRRS
ncbi:MAG: methyltransferase domain-containing protein [Elusimicrobia bacterium]|nr:methyltransferase domain-containing protein [Elusimicrobiota bacterium]